MLKSTPFNLFRFQTINAFLKSEQARLILSGRSIGKWRLAYFVFQVNTETRAIMIPTYRYGVCFYDQNTATGEIPIDDILQRAEAEHTRLITEKRLPEKPEKPYRKQITVPIGEIHEITTPHQKHRYVFYEGKLPIAGTNTEPFRIVAWAKWQTEEQPDQDPLIRCGIGLPKDQIGITAYLCCRDERPTEHPLTLVVFENGSAPLIIEDNNILEFPPRTYSISLSQRYRFKYPTEPTTATTKGENQ